MLHAYSIRMWQEHHGSTLHLLHEGGTGRKHMRGSPSLSLKTKECPPEEHRMEKGRGAAQRCASVTGRSKKELGLEWRLHNKKRVTTERMGFGMYEG